MPQYTNYQKREGKLWTYTYANNTKAQIGYVLINKKWKNSALNCEACSSFEGVSTDHRIVTAKIRLSLRKNNKRTATTKHYDWALLNNKDVRDKYVLELRNRFETLQEKTEKSTPNDEYENFVNAHNIYIYIYIYQQSDNLIDMCVGVYRNNSPGTRYDTRSFFRRMELIWIQRFLSSWLVGLSKLKTPVSPNILL